jgi:hypothetical protein
VSHSFSEIYFNDFVRHEYMGELGGKSFFQSNPDWDTKPVMALLGQHAKEMHGKPQFLP